MSKNDASPQGLWLEREPVDGVCPECASTNVARYPVNSEGGWWDVIKCQSCLADVRRERGWRLGPVHLLSDSL